MARERVLVIALALLAFACGALGMVAWHEHQRMGCWRDVAEDAYVPPTGDCDR